jgi:hypothetical protein
MDFVDRKEFYVTRRKSYLEFWSMDEVYYHSDLSGIHHLQNCKIWGFHGGDYEEWCLLGCYAVWLL